MGHDAFVSYASGDRDGVVELKRRIEAAGLSVWLDIEELRPGLPWQKRLREAVRTAKAVVVCIGSHGVGPWQQEEAEAALVDTKKDGRPVIGVLLPGAPESPDFPAFVDNRTWVSFRSGWSDGEIKRLVWGITGRKPGAVAPRFHDLPAVPWFFGREAELAKAVDALDPERRTWGVLIDGAGGVGKTALAVRAAERAPTEWFDRVAFVTAKTRELRATGEAALPDGLGDWTALLGRLAEELGEPEVGKLDTAARRAAVLRRLQDTRTLLVIDNLETLTEADRVHVFQLLERIPPGTKAIVTSRRRDDVDARVIRLDALRREECLALVDALAEDRELLGRATPAEREDLYRATGGNPLVVRWLAGQLGRGRCRTVTAALAFLAAAPKGNDPLEYVFGDLAASFTGPEAKVLAALSHFTEPVAAEHVTNLSGLRAPAAETALRDLRDRALVGADPEERRWSLAPLVGTYLRRAQPEAVAETGDRLCERVYALVIENGGNEHWERYAAIDEVWNLVRAAMPRFLDGENARLQAVCGALDFPLDHLGYWAEQEAWFADAEVRAVAAGDLWNAGWRAQQAGFAAFRLGAPARTLAAADRAAAAWAQGLRPREQAVATELRGHALRQLGQLNEAETAFTLALGEFRTVGSTEDVASAIETLAGLKAQRGDLEGAEAGCREALQLRERAGNRPGAAITRANLADLAFARGHHAEAEALARAAVADPAASLEVAAHACHTLAAALDALGQPDAALVHAERAVEIRARLRSPDLPESQVLLANLGAKDQPLRRSIRS